MSSELHATLVVSRKLDDDIKFRDVLVYVDDSRKAVLKFGQAASIELTPGEHVVYATNTILKSEKLSLTFEPGESKMYSTGNVVGGCLGLLAYFLVVPPRVVLKPDLVEPTA